MAYFQAMSSTIGVQYILVILGLYFGLVCSAKGDKKSEVLLCRRCGHSVVDGHEVVDIKSTLALGYKNVSVLGPEGILVQTFKNPQGMTFDVITVSKARIQEAGEAYEEHSWFPDYAWKLAACPRCQAHLGWTFTSTDDDDEDDEDDEDDYHDNERPFEKYKKPKQYSFAGLIVSKLIRESFADSLIITPNIYER